MEKCCKVCKLSDENDEGAILFQAPQEEKKRKAWSKACGVFLTKKCFVCQHHFIPSDIIGRSRGARLKSNALPILETNAEAKDNDVSDDNAPSVIVKAEPPEPPELVLVNSMKSKEKPTEEHDAFMDINVKLEMSETAEPLVLIHEAQFDEENSNVVAKITEKGNETKKGPVKRICGHIEIIDEGGHERFQLKCNICDMEWQIDSYSHFIDHIKDFHNKPAENKSRTETTITIPTLNDEKTEVKSSEVEDAKNQTNGPEAAKDHEESEDVHDDVLRNDHTDCESENSEENENNDTDYEPESKKEKKEVKIRKRRSSDGNCKTIKDNLVLFDHPDNQCVLDYLDLIKTYPILWHRRISIMKRFDEALEKCTAEFNTKWPNYQMTYEQSRTSINRIKDLYQRVTDPTHKRHIRNSTHLKKYPKYFEICAEIEENSKKLTNPCDNCRAFFFNEIDLQVHKFKLHRIGELPFKCSRCKYGFSKAETLAEHEQKHHRAKTFTCDVCNKGFFDEIKLHAHEATHTNDYKPVCEVCGEIFPTQSKYRRHRLHHEPPKEKCEICGKLYYEKWNLSEHIKSHRNERRYQCDICGKSFNHQNDVTIHKRGVHNVKPQPRKYVWVNKDSLDCNEEENDYT